jgi:hypothetical protein
MKPAILVTLNMREFGRLKVIQAVVDMGPKPGRAAERLSLTVRQIERLAARYRESGAARDQSCAHHFRFDGHHCDRVGSRAG